MVDEETNSRKSVSSSISGMASLMAFFRWYFRIFIYREILLDAVDFFEYCERLSICGTFAKFNLFYLNIIKITNLKNFTDAQLIN